jgi:branched-chain amino acid transport system ATP-binding protein/branched-chain amino acid transport system permease protein
MVGSPAVIADGLLGVERLTMRFGGLVAVSDVSFAARPREILSIIGPNGAGKTTVFNCITGFLRPTAGRIVFEGSDLTGLRPDLIVHRGIARTFQMVRLFPDLGVDENVMIGLHGRTRARTVDSLLHTPLHYREEAWASQETHRWLAFVGLEARAHQRARELACGDQRRLEIARALAAAPRLLILDEPASGMNPAEKGALIQLVGQIRESGVTVLLIEHDMSVVMGISDRIIVLDHGVVIAEGVPEEIRNTPAVIEAYLGRESES